MNRLSHLLRKPLSRHYFMVNSQPIQSSEIPLPLYTTDYFPIFEEARRSDNEIEMMKENKNVKEFVAERLPYMIFPQMTGYHMNIVLNMEFYRESKMLKMTCLDPRKFLKIIIFLKLKVFFGKLINRWILREIREYFGTGCNSQRRFDKY